MPLVAGHLALGAGRPEGHRVGLTGPPGAGKGTQGEQLASALAIPKVATGDVLRAAVRAGTALGREAKAYMDRTARRDPKTRDHMMQVTEVETLAPNFDLTEYFADSKAPKFSSLNVVVQNSGIMPLSPIGKGDAAIFDKVISVNLRGTFLVLAQAAQHISTGGRIIAFSSSVLTKSFPTYGPYIASKAGVEGLVHVLANDLRGRNVTVNAVAPGPIATDLFLKGKNAQQIAEFTKMNPLERMGQPSDIANVVSFLAGSDGGWINSQVLLANGGFAY